MTDSPNVRYMKPNLPEGKSEGYWSFMQFSKNEGVSCPNNELNLNSLSDYLDILIDNNCINIKPKWISVKDRLPDFDQEVLAANTKHKQWVAVRWNNGRDNSFDPTICPCCDGGRREFEPTHWMPLPEPPEVKDGDIL